MQYLHKSEKIRINIIASIESINTAIQIEIKPGLFMHFHIRGSVESGGL